MKTAPLIELSFLAMILGLWVGGCSTFKQEPTALPSAVTTTARVATTVPIEIEDNHVFVQAKVNGRPVRLMVDTGASHVLLAPKVAAAVGLDKTSPAGFEAFEGQRGSGEMGLAEAISIGETTLEKIPTFVVPVPTAFQTDGLMGLSFLRNFRFRLDYGEKSLSLLPLAGAFAGAGSSVSMQDDGLLIIEAFVDGLPARLIVDTGAGQSLILKSWFVQQHRLRERYPKRLSVVTGGGLLGFTRGEVARMQTLTLGNYAVTNVLAEFEAADAAQRHGAAGYVGAGILHRFNLTFDPVGHRMWFETNSSYAAEPESLATVRSGMVCAPSGIVVDVVPSSPATEAGVRVGDRLLAVNGQSFEALKFAGVKQAFRARPGSRLELRLQAAGEPPRESTLVLRDLL